MDMVVQNVLQNSIGEHKQELNNQINEKCNNLSILCNENEAAAKAIEDLEIEEMER